MTTFPTQKEQVPFTILQSQIVTPRQAITTTDVEDTETSKIETPAVDSDREQLLSTDSSPLGDIETLQNKIPGPSLIPTNEEIFSMRSHSSPIPPTSYQFSQRVNDIFISCQPKFNHHQRL